MYYATNKSQVFKINLLCLLKSCLLSIDTVSQQGERTALSAVYSFGTHARSAGPTDQPSLDLSALNICSQLARDGQSGGGTKKRC